MSHNGTCEVQLKTRHGVWKFVRVRLRDGAGGEVSLCGLDQGISQPLQHQLFYWATRLPYDEVAYLLHEQSGTQVLSEQSLWRLVQERAQELARQQLALISSPKITVPSIEAMLDAQTPEFVVMAWSCRRGA